MFTSETQPGNSRRFFADQVVTCIRAPCPAVRITGSYRATSDYLYLTSGGTTERYSWTLRGETVTLRQGRRVVFVFAKRETYCTQPADCAGQVQITVRCIGHYTCGQTGANSCGYQCGVAPGTCTSNAQCGRGEFCGFSEAGACGGAGTCTRRPEACIALYNPVCGCDGRTYGNACSAASSGVNVASNGEYALGAGECRDNSDCTGGAQYCRKTSCGEEIGTCATISVRCSNVYEPVCGCNGVTYNNGCMALTAGQNVASTGACRR